MVLGRLLAPWPALRGRQVAGPELSIIENVWALMSQKLARMDDSTIAAQLEASLNEIKSSTTLLHGLFDSIPRKMQDCIRLALPYKSDSISLKERVLPPSRSPLTPDSLQLPQIMQKLFFWLSRPTLHCRKMLVLGETPQFWEI